MSDIVERLTSVERDLNNGFPVTCDRMTTIQEAADRIEDLEAQLAKADDLAGWVEGIIEDGCPKCGGDCSSANPPPTYCPQQEAMRDLTEYRAAREIGT